VTDYSTPEFLPPSWRERAQAEAGPPGIPLQPSLRLVQLPLRHTRACLQRLGDLDGCDGECRPRTERLEAS
jgi:hypothetical protein